MHWFWFTDRYFCDDFSNYDVFIGRIKHQFVLEIDSKSRQIIISEGDKDADINTLNDSLKELIAKNHIESYFSGNEVCYRDKSLDCEPLCSRYCWSRHVSKNNECDFQCNSYECDYDGGDC